MFYILKYHVQFFFGTLCHTSAVPHHDLYEYTLVRMKGDSVVIISVMVNKHSLERIVYKRVDLFQKNKHAVRHFNAYLSVSPNL